MALKFARFFELIGFPGFNNSRKAIKARNLEHSIDTRSAGILLLTVYCLLFTGLGGCVSLQKEKVLAVVDGVPITEADLKYSLSVAHRREDLSRAGALNLSQYVQKMVDDRLMIEEAKRMGLDQLPEIQKAIRAYILRESVVRLHDGEILKKISVTEKDVAEYYRKFYEQYTVGLIEVKSEEEAKDILEQLKKGENFRDLAEKYSTHLSKKDGGEMVFTRNSMPSSLAKAVADLKPEEISDVIKAMDKYYVVKLISRKEPPAEDFNKVKGDVERALKKLKEKERSDEYLKYLREKADIKIDRELLSSVNLGGGKEDLEKLSKDERPLVRVNGSSLTVAEFVAMAESYPKSSGEDILNRWIDFKVVDDEAISRHYEKTADLKEMVSRYENQLLKNAFIKTVIIPRIEISDKTLKDYYSSHQKDFMTPARFRIQQITVKSMDDAEDILKSLKDGADFAWLAKSKSIDSAASKGGDAGWFSEPQLQEPVRKVIGNLKIGELSPIVKADSDYMVVRLQEKAEGVVEEFDKVKDAVYSAYMEDQVNNLVDKYVSELKTDAQIEIYDDQIRSLEEELKK